MWLRALQIYDWDYSELNNGKVVTNCWSKLKTKGMSKQWHLQTVACFTKKHSLRQLMLLNNLCPSGLSPKMAELPKIWFTASYVRNWQQQLWQMMLVSYYHFIHTALAFAERWGSLGLLKWKTAPEVEKNAIWGRVLSLVPFVYLRALCLQS